MSIRWNLLVASILLCLSGYAQKTDLELLRLPAGIESLSQYSQLIDPSGNLRDERMNELYYRFNPQGKLLALIHSELLPYCDQLLLIVGHVSEHSPLSQSSELITHTYTYPGGGERVQVSAGGSRYYSTISEGDDPRTVSYFGNDTLLVTLTYDDLLPVKLEQQLDGLPAYRDEYTYTRRGYLRLVGHFEADEQGAMQLKSSSYYTSFDKYGNPTELVSLYGSSALLRERSFVYEYDERGCWVKRLTFEEGRAIRQTVREVAYY